MGQAYLTPPSPCFMHTILRVLLLLFLFFFLLFFLLRARIVDLVWNAQTRYNEEDERAIVNGAHMNATLQQLVHKYVELFVLCPNCRLPESSEFQIHD